MRQSTRVLVIGGGPAGSTTATLLARNGIDVTLVEAERFPRYHIGESILPSCLPIFDLLGIREKMDAAGFLRKEGAYFEWGPENWELDFNHLAGPGDEYGYQVVRSEFDKLLLDHARGCGVDVFEETSVRAVEFDGDRAVRAQWARTRDRSVGGTVDFDVVVDASGRAGVLATKHLRSRRYNEALRNIAFWSYWTGVPAVDKGPRGAILVRSTPQGWFWLIPFADGRWSVGLVMNKAVFASERDRAGGMAELYERAIAECPFTAELLAGASRIDGMHADQDFSYTSEQLAGPGYLLAGDAACFLDPLLSTGVHLATFAGLLGAASLTSLLRGEFAESEVLPFYSRAYRQAYERMLVVVSHLYRESDRGAQLFQAQQLTNRDRRLMRLYESFLSITAGKEDLHDAADSRSLAVVASRLATTGHFAGEQGALPSTAQTSLGGLYLVTEPVLGLRRAAPVAVA